MPNMRVSARSKNLVSIIIPTFNRPDSLRRTLKSIMNQTYKNFEIIVVDDGSETDISKAINDFKIEKILRQDHMGASAARNFGFVHSRGNLLLFCDDDIELLPSFLEKMVKALERDPGKAFAYCGFDLNKKIGGMTPFDRERLKKKNYISTTSLIRRRNFLGFDLKLKRLQDWDLWLTMLEQGSEGTWVPEVLFKTTTENKPCISDDSDQKGWTYGHAYAVVSEKHKKRSIPQALHTLLIIYNYRSDLRKTYPEAKYGDYTALIEWAYNVSRGKISDASRRELLEYKDIFKRIYEKRIDKINKNELVTTRNELVTIRKEAIELQNELFYRYQYIKELETELSDLNGQIRKLLKEKSDANDRIGVLENELTNQRNEAARLRNELNAIISSKMYRIMKKTCNTIDFFLRK